MPRKVVFVHSYDLNHLTLIFVADWYYKLIKFGLFFYLRSTEYRLCFQVKPILCVHSFSIGWIIYLKNEFIYLFCMFIVTFLYQPEDIGQIEVYKLIAGVDSKPSPSPSNRRGSPLMNIPSIYQVVTSTKLCHHE